MTSNNISIYIHWPFCLAKCPYCDFNSHVAEAINHDVWLKSYLQELDYFSSIFGGKYIKSIFFGGGTPSLMEPRVVEGIIEKISSLAIIDNNTEITLEANPTSFEINKFKEFKTSGINRVSIGVQALKNKDLLKLGRQHDIVAAKQAIIQANNIFDKVSFDLIYARSGQTLKEWQMELVEACELASGHISLYQLTIEKGTAFYKLFHDGKLALPNNDLAAQMYEWTTEYLATQGYTRYEISNYARDSYECVHNLTYWNYQSYLGIGPGAHSRIISKNSVRSIMMYYNPAKWLSAVLNSKTGIQSSANLSATEAITECVMMGLRLNEGININNLWWLSDCIEMKDVINMEMVKYYYNLGLLIYSDKHIYFTNQGLILHNYLVPRLLVSEYKLIE